MRQVINGKMYNTETAVEIAGVRCGEGFAFEETQLYRKKTGEMFLAGRGGANTRWHCTDPGGMRGPGRGIYPLADDEARRWVETHCDTDEYIAIFGDPAE